MKSEEFVRRCLPQVKGSGPSSREPSETVRRSQGVVPQMRKSLRNVGESLRSVRSFHESERVNLYLWGEGDALSQLESSSYLIFERSC
ncbi:UNVERIFIED_CONTAM: hypothetical protein Sradi_2996200 [Sesamum radiatum]|uniref:Uncharacterized protein n=1 Tax=Sesamum radiatum TaxID=300843 RepID=A0AAW2S0T1_SESRA